MPARLKPVTDFTFQVLVGAFLFAVIFLAAVGISALVSWADMRELAPYWVLRLAEFAEKLLFSVDLAGFALFLVNEFLKLARSMWIEWKTE